MIVLREPLFSKNQTGRQMYRLVKQTAGDLRGLKFVDQGKIFTGDHLPLVRYFDYVRSIPYRVDPKPREIIARPRHIVRFENLGADCKKKSIMMGAWFEANRVPFRFVASSRRPDKKVHHVFPQALISGKWVNMDATYKQNRIAMKRSDTKQEVLKR